MEERYGQSQLRRKAEAHGYRVTGSQFQEFVKAGLLPPPDENRRWDASALEMLIHVRALGETIRTLPRRIVYLYPTGGFFIVEETVWKAMQAVAPNILDGDAKMRRAHAALLPLLPPATRAALPPGWEPPGADTWRGLIRLYTLADIEKRLKQWYRWGSDLTETLPDVSPEERVLLVALDVLAMQFTYALHQAEQWVTDAVPMRTAAERDAWHAARLPPQRDGEADGAAPRAVVHTRADWAFSDPVVQPEQADRTAENDDEAGGGARERRAAG